MIAERRWSGYAWAAGATVACTAVGLAMTPRFDPVNIAMVYLLAVVIVSLRFSRGAAISTAILSVAAFDFIFVPPQGSFTVDDLQYLLTFAILLAVALVITSLTENVRKQAKAQAALAVEAETERIRSTLLASISHDLRTPLAVMAGASSSLAERGERLSAEERQALAQSVFKQASEMSEQVAKVLQMTRLENDAIELERDWAALSGAMRNWLSRWKTSDRVCWTATLIVCSRNFIVAQARVRSVESASAFRFAAPSFTCTRGRPGRNRWRAAARRFASRCRSRQRRRCRRRRLPEMAEARPTILVVEDEPEIRRILRSSLDAEGYRVVESGTGWRGSIDAGTHKPDLAIVDLGLPDFDGVEVIRRIREWSPMPIVVLSARTQERAKIEALDAGADDYVTKPFGVGELLARLRVALRHAVHAGAGNRVLVLEHASVDLEKRGAIRDGKEIHLTPIEFRLVACLAKHLGMVVTHRQLLSEVWGPSHAQDTHYLRIYMKQLRDKLEKDPVQPRHFITETGVGYRLLAEESSGPV
jgi:two-component system KDP operon response regulator KdpE